MKTLIIIIMKLYKITSRKELKKGEVINIKNK